MQPQLIYHKSFPWADWSPCSYGLIHRCMQSKPLPNRRTLLYPKDGMRSLGYHQHHHPRARQWQDSLLSLHHSTTIRSPYEALVILKLYVDKTSLKLIEICLTLPFSGALGSKVYTTTPDLPQHVKRKCCLHGLLHLASFINKILKGFVLFLF